MKTKLENIISKFRNYELYNVEVKNNLSKHL